MQNWITNNIPAQTDRVIIITGANSGLGLEASRVLAQKGARVIMAVRSFKRGEEAKETILKEIPSANVELMELDLANLESIRAFAKSFNEKYPRLNILINNAGVMWPPKREETKQGFEVQFGVNHLGHFALTGLLIEALKATEGSRVVTLSSIAHKMIRGIDFDNLNWKKSYNKNTAYGLSKIANLLFTYELDRKLKEQGATTISVAAHPGVTATNLFRSLNPLVAWGSSKIGQSVAKGTLPLLRAATEEGLLGGEYFGPKGFMELSGYPIQVKSTKVANNQSLAKRLWEISEDLTGVKY